MPDLSAFAVVDWPVFAVACLVIAVAAAAQSAIGLGFGIVAAPILAILDPDLVPGTVLVLAVTTSAFVLIRDRADFRMGNLAYALSGRIVFSVLGGLTASLLPERWFLLVFSALILGAVGLSLSGWRLAPTRRNLLIAGCASGYMGTITSVGAPPIGLVYQHVPGPEARANISAFLVVGGAMSIGSLALFGAFGWQDLILSVKLLPAMLAGYWLSQPLKSTIDRGWLRPGMLGLCIAAAVLLFIRGIAGL